MCRPYQSALSRLSLASTCWHHTPFHHRDLRSSPQPSSESESLRPVPRSVASNSDVPHSCGVREICKCYGEKHSRRLSESSGKARCCWLSSAHSLLPLLRLRKVYRGPPTQGNSHRKAPPLQTGRSRTIRMRGTSG